MAITTQFLTGFEHGFVASTATAGGGLFTTVTANVSASTSSPRNGSYCARVAAPASTVTRIGPSILGSPTKVVSRFAVKVSSRPSSGVATIAHVVDLGAGIAAVFQVSSAGVLQAQIYTGTAQIGPTIDTTGWHLIEFQIDTTAKTLDWKVDGVAQTRATTTATTTTITNVYLGTNSSAQPAFTADYDDFIVGTWTVAGTDWYGDGKVLAQLAGSDGTHQTQQNFSQNDAGTIFASTPAVTNCYAFVDDLPGAGGGTGGWTATRSTSDCLAMRVASTSAYLEIKPAVTAQTGTANAVRALLSYSSPTATANLAACDVRNSAGAVSELWGLTGGVGKDYSEITNFFKGAVATPPAAGWTAAEVNAIRFRFGGCTSADISPVPTVQALMLEVDWFIAPPTITSVARISLASALTPDTRTAHKINVRARKASGTGTVELNAALYEGATNRSGDLTTALTTTLANYSLAIPDASAANITDYSDLELRIWADSPTGDAVNVEVAELSVETPEGTVTPPAEGNVVLMVV